VVGLHDSCRTLTAAALLLTALPLTAAADPVRIFIGGRVESVYDPGDALRGAIHPGLTVRATITYDAAVGDADPLPAIGRYEFRQAPSGIVVEVGAFVFQSHPDRVNLSIVLSNDQGTPPHDTYVVTSTSNLPFQYGAVVSRIALQLTDDTLQALRDSRLTPDPPALAGWRSGSSLSIEGQNGVDYLIKVRVTEIRKEID
jgi:hypothetical protein